MENKEITSILAPNVCNHPDIRPTSWDQPRPAPSEMVSSCGCGKRQSCLVCGWGTGVFPCECEQESVNKYAEKNRYIGDFCSLKNPNNP